MRGNFFGGENAFETTTASSCRVGLGDDCLWRRDSGHPTDDGEHVNVSPGHIYADRQLRKDDSDTHRK